MDVAADRHKNAGSTEFHNPLLVLLWSIQASVTCGKTSIFKIVFAMVFNQRQQLVVARFHCRNPKAEEG